MKRTATETPDKWVIIRIEDGTNLHKVLCGWIGGYLGADEWRMSSGITKVVSRKTHYEVHNLSGSIYECSKGGEGFTSLMTSILEALNKEKTLPKVSVIDMKEYLKSIKTPKKVKAV